jgi:hypothetical protein
MSSSFKFVALPAELFTHIHTLSDSELKAMGAYKVVADEAASFPCRVSLTDAEVGETLISLNYVHHVVETPYRSSGPIFVRPGAETARPEVGAVPVMFNHRLLSLRSYSSSGIMVDSTVIQGKEIRQAIENFFSNQSVDYIDVHNARPGCYNCRVVRA